MGIYLNPGNALFQESIQSKIYVDKTGIIAYTNEIIHTKNKYICVSRPRRFGKSTTAEMLAAYYGKDDSRKLFQEYKIAKHPSFCKHLNKYHVILLNMQDFLSSARNISEMRELIEKSVLWDFMDAYPDIRYFDKQNLIRSLQDIYMQTKTSFVFIIDEWDCIFRENKSSTDSQKSYLDFLRSLLKDKPYVALAYMTGILPVKKYGTHSALNMFDEYSMTNPRQLAEYTGFTEAEAESLCSVYHMGFAEVKRWYDGYRLTGTLGKKYRIYSPRSVVSAMLSGICDTYWNQTETFEALKNYIVLNFDGLKDTVIALLAGEHIQIETGAFTNDMTTFESADDVLTLLVHLGYLGFDFEKKEAFIPNYEISMEFVSAVRSARWDEAAHAIRLSDQLLKDIWNADADAVAAGIEKAHFETSILNYNDENALSYTISLAFYSARRYYTVVREFPAGKGFADLVFLPRPGHFDKPAMIIELKWNHSAKGAIAQIKSREYPQSLACYQGKLLLAGISYDKKNKKHTCEIEFFSC